MTTDMHFFNISFNLSLLVIILIIGIIYHKYINDEKLEQFSNAPTTTTSSNGVPSSRRVLNDISQSSRISQLDSITDTTVKTAVLPTLTNFKTTLGRYTNLDTPITINDKGKLCSMWNNYSNGKYRLDGNKCMKIKNTYKCLDTDGSLNTCNQYYTDGFIEQKNNIDYQPILDDVMSRIINNIEPLNTTITNKNTDADKLISDLSNKNLLYQQQSDIMKNLKQNLAEKQNFIKQNTKKISTTEIETNINQSNFSNFLSSINDNNSWNNIYYKVVIGLIIAIVIMLILNFLFSNILI